MATNCVLDVNVKGRIVLNEGNLLDIDVTMKKDWIQPLTSLNKATFLSMHLENKLIIIDLLKAIRIRDSFPSPQWFLGTY
jgi:hypothetical protein